MSGINFYDYPIHRRLIQSNILEGQSDGSPFSKKQSLVENTTESYNSIPRISSLISAKELSHRKLRSDDIWTDSSLQTPNDLTEMASRSDYFNYLEEYNTLAKKYGVRVIYSSTFKSSMENLRSASLRHESWFSRKILRRQSSPHITKDKYVRHKKSLSDVSFRKNGRKDKFKGKNLQELAHYLVKHGTTTRGLFRVPGSHNTVNDLYNYFCNSCEQSDAVAGTICSPVLPGHIKCDVHDIASAFKKFLIGLPGGIIGSPTLFDAFLSINIQLNSGSESMRTKLSHVRVRLIALAVLNLSSESRRNLIYAVFGLLCMIGQAAEAMKIEEVQDKSLPTSELMDFNSLGTIFGPIIIGDLIGSYSMQKASPKGGLILLPISPPKSRKEQKMRSGGICDEFKEVVLQIDKIEMANKITEMLLTEWCDVVQHIKNLTSQNHEWIKKRSSTCSTTQLIMKPYLSEEPPKNSIERNKPFPADSTYSKTLPSVIKEPSTTYRSGTNANVNQSSILESFLIREPLVEGSFCLPPQNFSEEPNKGLEARSRRRKLASPAATSNLSQPCSQITTNNMSFAHGAHIDESFEDLVRKLYTPGKSGSSIKSNNAARLSKNRSYLPISTERKLKRSNFRSKKLSLGQKIPQIQGKISTQVPAGRFHYNSGLCSQVLSQNSVKYTPNFFYVSDTDPNLKPLRKNRYTLDPLNDNLEYLSRILTPTENGSFVTVLKGKDSSVSEKLSRAPDQRSIYQLHVSHEANHEKNITPQIYLHQNEDRIMKPKFNFTSQTDESTTPLGSMTRSTSRRSNKMSCLLAKFENDIFASSNLNVSNDLMKRSDQSGNRLLGEYTKNSPLKPKKSIQSDDMSQKAIPTFKYLIPDPEIIRSNDLNSRRSFINLKDTSTLSLRRVKSFIEKPIKKTTKVPSGIVRPFSVTNPTNGQYMMSNEMSRGFRKGLNNSSLSSCSKQEFTIHASSARKLVHSDIGTEEDESLKYLNSVVTFTPGRSIPLLYDQVRILQRQLDKKCEEVQKLKQQAGTWHDITVGALKKNLEDSRRHAQYWQEKAKFFKLRFYSLHQALSSRNSHEKMYLSHETDVFRSNPNLNDFSISELTNRLIEPSQVDKWETKSWNSDFSNGTVIRGLRKSVTESELSSYLK